VLSKKVTGTAVSNMDDGMAEVAVTGYSLYAHVEAAK